MSVRFASMGLILFLSSIRYVQAIDEQLERAMEDLASMDVENP